MVEFNAAHNASLRAALKGEMRSDLTKMVTGVTILAGDGGRRLSRQPDARCV
ncbi:MAG TPA: hypothetical protein VF876_10025 [Burkholderiales bacterium]